jgi:DNA-binding PadR family transcriptional regulator
VKFLILSVLEAGPKHGYEIIREIEQRAQGAYAPSPGTIYPTLQMLEDMGYVRSEVKEERRVYELTDAGRAYLKENAGSTTEAWEQFQGHPWRGMFPGFGSPEQRELQHELMDLARALFGEGRIFRADPKVIGQVRDAIRAARTQIDAAFTRQTL